MAFLSTKEIHHEKSYRPHRSWCSRNRFDVFGYRLHLGKQRQQLGFLEPSKNRKRDKLSVRAKEKSSPPRGRWPLHKEQSLWRGHRSGAFN